MLQGMYILLQSVGPKSAPFSISAQCNLLRSTLQRPDAKRFCLQRSHILAKAVFTVCCSEERDRLLLQFVFKMGFRGESEDAIAKVHTQKRAECGVYLRFLRCWKLSSSITPITSRTSWQNLSQLPIWFQLGCHLEITLPFRLS